jgi:hypothetical protein
MKYPEIQVQLTGSDGNAFAILGAVTRELKRARVPKDEIDAYVEEATAGSYDELLATTMRWVNVL